MGASFLSNLTNILLSARRANVRQAVCMELETVLISRQRLSCRKPNLQQLPSDSGEMIAISNTSQEELNPSPYAVTHLSLLSTYFYARSVFGVKPRDAIVPSAREGRCVFACDYSQKEVRILAHMRYDDDCLRPVTFYAVTLHPLNLR